MNRIQFSTPALLIAVARLTVGCGSDNNTGPQGYFRNPSACINTWTTYAGMSITGCT